MKNDSISAAAALLFMIGLVSFYFWMFPVWQTNTILKRAVSSNQEIAVFDGWGKQIKTEKIDTPYAIGFIAISSGRDGLFGTQDDLRAERIDLNKTKLVGKYAGERVKRMAGGFWEGLFTPDKFKSEK